MTKQAKEQPQIKAALALIAEQMSKHKDKDNPIAQARYEGLRRSRDILLSPQGLPIAELYDQYSDFDQIIGSLEHPNLDVWSMQQKEIIAQVVMYALDCLDVGADFTCSWLVD